MFTIVYVYRLPPDRVDEFIRIQRAAAAIYVEHGAVDDETLSAVDVSPQYGCRGFGEAFGAAPDEAVLLGISRFRDRSHHDEVMAKVNDDPRIDELFAEVTEVVRIDEIARGEFERAI